jgi:hypothetical protein
MMQMKISELFFSRKEPEHKLFPPEQFEPVIRSSICTGERTACMRDRQSGKVHEIMLIRTSQDLAAFAKQYGVDTDDIETIF